MFRLKRVKETSEKAMSLYELHKEVMDSWFDFTEKYSGWIIKVTADYFILEAYDNEDGETKFSKVDYTIQDGVITFSEPVRVEQEFLPKQEKEEEIVVKVPTKAISNELKAIGLTDDTLIVGNYIALFGGRDLEGTVSPRKNKDGSAGEFFTPNTVFESDFTKTVGRLPVDWEHGMMTSPEEPGKDEILGYVDWSTAKADSNGLFVQRVLNRRNKYVSMLQTLIEEGLIGTSSQALPEKVQKNVDGEILTWPLIRDSLTVCPMEPRMIGENSLNLIKSLALEVPEFKASCIEAGVLEETDNLKLELEIKNKLVSL
jgi:hypothetical protein